MKRPQRPADADEAYVWEERLAILMDGEKREPTEREMEMADADVRRFQQEVKERNQQLQ